MGQLLASFVKLVGLEKYCVFLICSLEKDFHFQEKAQKSQEKILGRVCINPVHIVLDGRDL